MSRLIYIKDELNYFRRYDLESPEIESVRLEIKLKRQKTFLVSSYTFSLCQKLNGQTNFLAKLKNIDFKDGTYCNTKWKHVVETNDLHQLIRLNQLVETIIDHIYMRP